MTEFVGDVEAVIDEMKRRGAVATDTQLAAIIGTSQSNVSTWRKRGSVPKAVLRNFDQRVEALKDQAPLHFASMMIAYSLAEYWLREVGGGVGDKRRWLVLMTLAAGHTALIAAVKENILKQQAKTKLTSVEVAEAMANDEVFLEGLRDWIKDQSAVDVVMRSI